MPSLPPEINSLITTQVWLLSSPSTQSNFILAWPEMAPFARERRFKDISIRRLSKMRELMDIMDAHSAVAIDIQRMELEIPYPYDDTQMISLLVPPLVTRAVNLQELSLQHFKWEDPIPFIGECPNLTMLSLCDVCFPRLSDFLNALLSIPNLTTLNIRCLQLDDLKALALEMWPTAKDQKLEACNPPWDTRGFEAPKAVLSRLCCLEIHILWMSDLMLLDLLSSGKTPFPNLREITLVPCYAPPRGAFSTLLQRYPSLRMLYIQCYLCDSDTGSITVPPTVEDFRFILDPGLEDRLCETLTTSASGENLRTVSIYLETTNGPWENVGGVDEVLAGMGLERISLESRNMELEEMEGMFPLCMKQGRTKASRLVLRRTSYFSADSYYN